MACRRRLTNPGPRVPPL
uniref:Uncharacterized protein n=1 Tax=Arundo donax TaxID=35708 RepID=A0A0A9GMJ1_ARUDO